jgi:FkbM family methyltransferase
MEILGMKINKNIVFFCLLFSKLINADFYEGVDLFRNTSCLDCDFLRQFLPYDPVILEVGAFRGQGVLSAAKTWPKSRIIAFEPEPYGYAELEKNVEEARLTNVELHSIAVNSYNGSALFNVCLGPNNNEPAYGYASSLLPLKKGMEVYCKGHQIEVPCVTLDSWCEENNIGKIDLLRLEIEGAEFTVLKSSPKLLKNVQIIHVKTYIHPHRLGATNYPALKELLEKNNFVLLSHRYQPDIIGHAIFLCRDLFDAYFKRSLGVYLEK